MKTEPKYSNGNSSSEEEKEQVKPDSSSEEEQYEIEEILDCRVNKR